MTANDLTPRSRRPRFKRADPPPLRITADDLAILQHVSEHRFLRSTHLVTLIDRSPEKLIRRLAALFHTGYLDRPPAQIDYFARSGSAPLIYALGTKGASMLHGTAASGIDWTDKNRTITRPYIEHAIMLADLMVGIECATRSTPTVQLVSAQEISKGGVWTITATTPDKHVEISVTPDKVFALDFHNTARRNYFFVEADRATMPIERASLAQSSFKKKLLAYHHAHQQKRHVAHFGIPGFRVLTITTSTERIASMIEVVRTITDGRGSNVFLFADALTLSANNPLTLEWTTGKGGKIRLIG